jgi:hypothetical protein
LRRSASNFNLGTFYCRHTLNPENQGDVEVVELQETGTQPGVVVWFVEGTVVIDDWADTIARRGQGGKM